MAACSGRTRRQRSGCRQDSPEWAKWQQKFLERMVRTVNDTKDNDTIGAIVGAALGALYGREAFAPQWVMDLSGRTSIDDAGRVFEIIEAARKTFWDEK